MLKHNTSDLRKLAASEEKIMQEISNIIDGLEHYNSTGQPDLLDRLNGIRARLSSLEVNSANRVTSVNTILKSLGIEKGKMVPYNKKFFYTSMLPKQIECDADLWILTKREPMSDQELRDDLADSFYGEEDYFKITTNLTHIEFFRKFIEEENVIREQKEGRERFLKKSGMFVKQYDDERSILEGATIWTTVDDLSECSEYFEMFRKYTNVFEIDVKMKDIG